MQEYVYKSEETARGEHRKLYYAGMPSITPVTYDNTRKVFVFSAAY